MIVHTLKGYIYVFPLLEYIKLAALKSTILGKGVVFIF